MLVRLFNLCFAILYNKGSPTKLPTRPFIRAVVVAQVVARLTTDREVLGSNPAATGSWAFFSQSRLCLFSFLSLFPSVVRPKSGPSWRFSTFQEHFCAPRFSQRHFSAERCQPQRHHQRAKAASCLSTCNQKLQRISGRSSKPIEASQGQEIF